MSTVVGYFDAWDQADDAVQNLLKAGVHRDDLSVIANSGGKDRIGGRDEVQVTDPNGAAAGATTGAVLGGAVGVAIGLGALVIPGVGPLLAAGPLASALAGGAAGAAAGGAAGGLLGALMDAGVPKDRAERYIEGVKKGGVLVTVRTKTEAQTLAAENILDRAGAADLTERGRGSTTSPWLDEDARR